MDFSKQNADPQKVNGQFSSSALEQEETAGGGSLQLAANQSPQITQLKQLQDGANQSAQVQGALQRQEAISEAPIQRTIKVSHSSTIDSTEHNSYKTLMNKADEVGKKRNWDSQKLQAVKDELKAMVENQFEFDATKKYPNQAGRNPQSGYVGAINLATTRALEGKGVDFDPDEEVKEMEFEELDFDPSNFSDEDEKEELESDWEDELRTDILVGNDCLSPMREETMDEDELPPELKIPYTRRDNEANEKQSKDMDFAFGGYQGTITFDKSQFSRPRKGGMGLSYESLLGKISAALMGSMTEAEFAKALIQTLEGRSKGIPKSIPSGAWPFVDEFLAVIANSEMSRGTIALISAVAALKEVEQGNKTLVEAFSGEKASFLGANDGGASLLRRTKEDDFSGDAKKNKAKLLKQRTRGNKALNNYLKVNGVPMKNKIKKSKKMIRKNGDLMNRNLVALNRKRKLTLKEEALKKAALKDVKQKGKIGEEAEKKEK